MASRSHLMNALVENFLHSHRYGRVVHSATTGNAALEAIESANPDWLVMESILHEPCCVEVVKRCREISSVVRIIVFAHRVNIVNAVRLVKAGATSFLCDLESGEDLRRQVGEVLQGRRIYPTEVREVLDERDFEINSRKYLALSGREREILQFVALGYSNSEIGGKCGISQRTVEQHRRHIADKTGMRTIADLTRFAVEEGLV